jgi:hypothetical protein
LGTGLVIAVIRTETKANRRITATTTTRATTMLTRTWSVFIARGKVIESLIVIS